MNRLNTLHFSSAFTPNTRLSRSAYRYTTLAWLILCLVAWLTAASPILPTPLAVVRALPSLWFDDGLGEQLWVSLRLNIEADAIMIIFSLALSYLTVMPVARPPAQAISVGRFNGFVGLPLILTLYLGDAHSIKIALLVYGMSVYTVPAIVKLIELIPRESFDDARTLRMGEWRVVWEVVILGQFDNVIEILQNTLAMGWMMLPMVEGLFRSEGGLGALIDVQNKHFNLAAEYAVVLLILAIGLTKDYLIGVFKRLLCPYSGLGLERA